MIDDAVLDAVVTAIGRDADLGSLRQAFPDLHFSACMDDDVSPRIKAVRTTPTHAIYLITGATGHCLAFTGETAAATGLLIAERAEDDEA